MIKMVMDMLNSSEWLKSGCEEIEIAKGKHELPKTYKGVKNKMRRIWQSKK